MRWGLLELELRRPDTERTMLCLLASAYVATGAELLREDELANVADELVTVLALKAALCRVLRELAQRASAASVVLRRLTAESARESSATEAARLCQPQIARVSALETAQWRRRQVCMQSD
jgi:hypothetical protein